MNLTSMTTTRGNEQEVLRYAVISLLLTLINFVYFCFLFLFFGGGGDMKFFSLFFYIVMFRILLLCF